MRGKRFRVFISYRREDSRGYAGWLQDQLERRYGEGSVFLDTEDIDLGAHFPLSIDKELQVAGAVLCLIGSGWMGPSGKSDERPRIHRPQDWVRMEVGAALKSKSTVIPILLDGTPMPRRPELPPSLKSLPDRNGLPMSLGTWKSDFERLCAELDRLQPSSLLGGSEIVSRHEAWKSPPGQLPIWVGCAGGLNGSRLQEQVRTGRWRDQPYEVLFVGSKPNHSNWFSVNDFVRVVSSAE